MGIVIVHHVQLIGVLFSVSSCSQFACWYRQRGRRGGGEGGRRKQQRRAFLGRRSELSCDVIGESLCVCVCVCVCAHDKLKL